MKNQTLNIFERASGSLFFLSFDSLSLAVGTKTIFEDVSCCFHYNGIVLIKGPVGSGKSTVLKMLGGLIEPRGGAFVHRNSGNEAVRGIYIHSQPEFNFITGCVRDELTFAEIKHSAFPELLGRSVYDMSGGELKKLSIMMALKGSKDAALLVDEPLDMLDDKEASALAETIICESKKRPFIIATHDAHFDEAADVIMTIGGLCL